MPKPTEHKTVQTRLLAYAQEIGWRYVPRAEAEARRGKAQEPGLSSPGNTDETGWKTRSPVWMPVVSGLWPCVSVSESLKMCSMQEVMICE